MCQGENSRFSQSELYSVWQKKGLLGGYSGDWVILPQAKRTTGLTLTLPIYKHRSFQQINLIHRSFPACKKMWCIGSHLWMEVTGWVTSGLARSTWIPSKTSQNWLCGAWNPWRKEQQTLDICDACRAVFTCSTKLGKQACQKKDDLNQSHILQVMLQIVLQEMMSGGNHQNRASMKTQEKANQSLTPAH